MTELEEGYLAIDVETCRVVAVDDRTATLLGSEAEALTEQSLGRALNISEAVADAVFEAVKSRQSVALPPFLARSGEGAELVLEGGLRNEGGDVARLLLRRLPGDGLAVILSPADTLAVLAVDGISYDAQWDVADTASLVADIHRSLNDIVRKSDRVSVPSVASIAIVIRDASEEEARDICLALLSHLHGDTRLKLAQNGLRIKVGLAQRASAPAALLAAHYALLQARAGSESICRAREGDFAALVGKAVTEAGMLRGPLFGSPAGAPNLEAEEVVPPTPAPKAPPPVAPIETGIEGYVVDNMEGAVDQAIFLAGLDVPIAVIGPAGTGKMYIARIIHEEAGGSNDTLVSIDCREFRSRNAAKARIAQELERGEGRTLVFKSPHLMHAEVQTRLARQVSSRRLADVSPPRYLPRVKLIALFPEPLEALINRGELTEPLASAFAGFPIYVPPIRDRKQAVLRWAHKILGQEGALRDRDMKGFTPDAEQAMLLYDWPGNISEMRQCIHDALEKTDKDWLTPVDLGLYRGINPEGAPGQPTPRPFLSVPQVSQVEEDTYAPTTLESINIALGEAVYNLLTLNLIKPLGLWIDDELVLAALDRYRGDSPRAAEFLHTRSRNISRWMPKIKARDDERNSSALWQEPRRMLREWVRESPPLEESPLSLMGDKLMAHLTEMCGELSTADRARIVGVSTPTYLKRLREQQDREQGR